jgi:hypothetical protein
MAARIKSGDRVIENESGTDWKIERRTRGQDAISPDTSRPVMTWIVILSNDKGYRQFIPENKFWTLFRPHGTELEPGVAVVESE